VSTLTAPAEPSLQAGPARPSGRRRDPCSRAPLGRLRVDALWWQTIIVAAIICFVTFLAGGGLHL